MWSNLKNRLCSKEDRVRRCTLLTISLTGVVVGGLILGYKPGLRKREGESSPANTLRQFRSSEMTISLPSRSYCIEALHRHRPLLATRIHLRRKQFSQLNLMLG